MRTGVIQPLPGIGDMVWFLPALRTIAANAPGGKITLFARASCLPASLFAHEPMIEQVVILPKPKRGGLSALTNLWGTWQALRQAKPDRLFVLHHSPRYQQAAKLAGVRDVIAYPPLTDKTYIDGWVRSRSFLASVGLPVEDPTPRLSVAPELVATVAERYAGLPKPWIIMTAGASEPVRRWPPENFAKLAEALVQATGGTIFLTGAPSDAEIVARLTDVCAAEQSLISLVGRPLEEAMALMTLADCLVGCDSGPPNLAAALGCPTISLLSLDRPPLHSPCLEFIYPPDGQDVRGTDVQTVITAALTGLEHSKRNPE